MRSFALITVTVLFASAWADAPLGNTSHCLAADSTSADLIDDITDIVTGTAAADSVFRANLHLPRVAANQVTLVSSDSVCYAAITGLDPADTASQAYVLRVGSSAYVVRFSPAEAGTIYFFTLDSTFTRKAMVAI